MTWHNKVMWTEGMFLQPQHFQQQDRYVTRSIDARLRLSVGYAWGFHSLAIDEAALHQGKLALSQATGVFRDGTPFALPMDDPAPLAIDVAADVRDARVVLALALVRPGVAESDVEDASAAMPARFHATEMDVADSHAASLRQAPLQIGRLNLRLMLERDANEGYSCLGVARIVERRSDGRLLLDPQHLPPMLHVPENTVADGFAREIIGLLHQRGEALAARLAQPGRAGVGEISDFLLLQICNRFEPQLVHARQSPVLHAEHFFALLLGLAGELSTFRDSKRPSELVPYNHDDPARCFNALMNDLRQSLSMVPTPSPKSSARSSPAAKTARERSASSSSSSSPWSPKTSGCSPAKSSPRSSPIAWRNPPTATTSSAASSARWPRRKRRAAGATPTSLISMAASSPSWTPSS